jgi:regulation of enolase protein 1 (concanavalin A-like superfamily)
MVIDSDGIDRVEFYQGSTLISSSSNGRSDGSQAYTATWGNVAAATYTLTARAFDALGASTTSGPVHITVSTATAGLPPPWATQGVGAVSPAGSATGDGVQFTMQGSGDDIWGTADAFHFLYQPLTGDGQIVARVLNLQNTNPWAKAGVMIREDLTVAARHASLFVTPSNGVAFEWRSQGNSVTNYVGASGAAPQWVKLVRTGATIIAYISTDGNAWTTVSSTALNTAATVYIGLAVTSHQNGVLCAASFDNIGF